MDDCDIFLYLDLVGEIVFLGEECEVLGNVGGVCLCGYGFVLEFHLLFHVAQEMIGSLGAL